MALIARLVSYAAAAFGARSASGPEPGSAEDDVHLAVTALLVHVARADGVLDPNESERLARIVRTRYAASETEARDLIARAAAFDAETRDMASLVEMIGRGEYGAGDGGGERERILVMAWAVAGADREVHEFEEALVWRLGQLLGLDDAGIAQARETARGEMARGLNAPSPGPAAEPVAGTAV